MVKKKISGPGFPGYCPGQFRARGAFPDRAEPLILPGAYPGVFPGALSQLDDLPIQEGICNFPPGLMQVAPDRFPGNTKYPCRRFLLKSLDIDQFQELDFIGEKRYGFHCIVSTASWGIAPCRKTSA